LIDEYKAARTDFGKLQDWRRETKNAILRFYREQKAKGYKINMARNSVIGVMAFYSQNCETVKGITRELDPVQIPDNEFVFNQEILRKLYYYGNLQEKAWLSTAVSLGYSSIDFLALETKKIGNLIREAKDKHQDFIGFIGKTRTKTSVQPRSFLTPEAIENLSEYLKMLESQNGGKLPKYLWDNATNDSLNNWLKALIRKANIDTYGRDPRFHGLRKFVYDTLSKMDEIIASVITAKKTNASKMTYRTSLDSECERIFKECYKQMALNGDASGKVKLEQTEKILQLENALSHLEDENLVFKTRVDSLQKRTQDLDNQLTSMNSALDFIRIEDLIRFVSAKCPTQEEMFEYLKRSQTDTAILKRVELSCLTYSPQTKRWHYLPELDIYKIGN
jgi:integrase